MKTFRQFLRIFIVGILLFFLVKPFVQTHKQLEVITFQIQWRWLVTSFGVILIYRSLYVWPFTKLLCCIFQEGAVPFRNVFTLFHLTNITRYLPGRIWGVVRLLSLSSRFGLSKTAVGGSFTLHVGIETTLGGLIAMPLLFSKQMRDTALSVLEKVSGHLLLFTLAIVGIIAGAFFLILRGSTYARQTLKTLREVGQPFCQKSFWISSSCLRGDGGIGILASHILLWICQGLAFYLFVRSLAPVAWTDAGILTACYAFAWIVGFLSFLTPGGLGIREGLLGFLLPSYMSVPQAMLVALLCRVWMLSAELILASIAFFFTKTETSRNFRLDFYKGQ